MLRELNRRCNYDTTQVIQALEALKDPFILPDSCDKLEELQKLYERFIQPSVVSIEYITYRNAGLLSESHREDLINILERMLQHPPFEITNIHDEFKCLPNHVNRMKEEYKELLVEMYCSDWWFEVAQELTGEDLSCIKSEVEPEVIDQIRKVNYAIN
jgi:AAA+ ATPase superfamily predicted ATPase